MPNDAAAGLHDAAGLNRIGEAGYPPPHDLLLSGRTLREILEATEPLPAVSQAEIGTGEAAWISAKCPGKTGQNEDSLIAVPLPGQVGLLLVADGLGGHRGGRKASQRLRQSLARVGRRLADPPAPAPHLISGVVPVPSSPALARGPDIDSRTVILDEIERVNKSLLRARLGSASTLALVELRGRRARTYHVGDSEILIMSQRGRIKYSTVSHSPVGYALESGLLTEAEALRHPDRHIVSNVVGSDQMSVELGPWIALSPRDTVLLGSDGLFDNLTQLEIVERIRKGRLTESVLALARAVRERMLMPHPDQLSKPDDLTILAYRPTRPRR